MTFNDPIETITQWEDEAKRSEIKLTASYNNQIFTMHNIVEEHNNRILKLSKALRIALLDLNKVKNIDQGKLSNLANVALMEIKKLFQETRRCTIKKTL